MADEHGFAYLFERFPAFSQTFCFREVAEVRRQNIPVHVFAVRKCQGEHCQDFPPEVVGNTEYLPDCYDSILKNDTAFRRQARQGLYAMRRHWGSDAEKHRIYEAIWLGSRLRALGIGHVHAHFAGLAARTAFWMKQFYGIRFSFTAHANDVFTNEADFYVKHLVREACLVVTETDFSANYLRRKYPDAASRVARVYNGMEFGPERARKVPGTNPLILSVGRYIEKKGFEYLIQALGDLRERNFRCLIVGQGPREEALREQVKEQGLEDRVEITGPRTQSQITQLLDEASVFALPCVNEDAGGSDNLPTVIMEAMGAGVPVISTRVAGIPEMVDHDKTGLLVGEKNVKALSSALGSLLDDPLRAEEMGKQGRLHALAHFDIARTTSQLIELLQTHGAFHPVSTSQSLAARIKSRLGL